MTFLELPWEDVVFPLILPCLPLQTLFQLRRVSLKGKIVMFLSFFFVCHMFLHDIALWFTVSHCICLLIGPAIFHDFVNPVLTSVSS